ncbi:hypothetical protein R9C00_08895 [Flammeovirgaceae bacterium SG7u.111]|nr:hypothetical protein [Flammeovirgaceae bacterium SG7u.132]WPO37565.1 hypothetical protein R9C00_08895 [Flammeovirgaceae bacterium SG7u.111]
MVKNNLLLLICLMLFACEDTVRFEEAQPASSKNLGEIPKKLRGTYFSPSDSMHLTITEHAMVNWMEIDGVMLIDSLDLELDSTKIVKQTPDFTQVIGDNYEISLSFFSPDSVRVHYYFKDTLFAITDQQVLKKFKGNYFLNYERGENSWEVRRLTLKKDELLFSRVKLPEDIEKVKEVTELQEVTSDSGKVVGYKLNPGRKELKKLMKSNFLEISSYRRLD